VTWATYVPILVFWASLFSTSALCTRQTDVRRASSLNAPYSMGGGIKSNRRPQISRQGSYCWPHRAMVKIPLKIRIVIHVSSNIWWDSASLEIFHSSSLSTSWVLSKILKLAVWYSAVAKILLIIPVSESWSGSQSKSNQLLVTRPAAPKIFIRIRRLLFELSCWQTDRQTDKSKNMRSLAEVIKNYSLLLKVYVFHNFDISKFLCSLRKLCFHRRQFVF